MLVAATTWLNKFNIINVLAVFLRFDNAVALYRVVLGAMTVCLHILFLQDPILQE